MPVLDPRAPVTEPSVNWFRNLKGDRLEVCLKSRNGLRLRASGHPDCVWALVSLFEEMADEEVVGEWRRPPRSGSRPMSGQLAITLDEDGTD